MKETGPSCDWPGLTPGLRFEMSGLEYRPIANAFPLMEGEECEARRVGIYVEEQRHELAVMIEGSEAEISRKEHRELHAGDFARWGRLGGLATARLYGTAWMALLARRRWERIGAEALAEAFATINRRRF